MGFAERLRKDEIKNPVIRSTIAHLYFESIHPFEDANGRIGRAISEKALSQGFARPVLLSFSETIEANKKHYYEALKNAQRSNDITGWLIYFSNTVLSAQIRAEENVEFILNNQWPRLINYVKNGGYLIDNNSAENAIRPLVISLIESVKAMVT